MKTLLLFLLATAAMLAPLRAADPAPANKILAAIPAANPKVYAHIKDSWEPWRNPVLRIKNDVVMLNGSPNGVPPEKVPEALAALSPNAWPYGRVVAVFVCGIISSEAQVKMQTTALKRLQATLKSVGFKADLWPNDEPEDQPAQTDQSQREAEQNDAPRNQPTQGEVLQSGQQQ